MQISLLESQLESLLKSKASESRAPSLPPPASNSSNSGYKGPREKLGQGEVGERKMAATLVVPGWPTENTRRPMTCTSHW